MFDVDLPPVAFPEAPVRAKDLRYVIGCIRQGQCCSVVAPSNMGKSLLLKSLPIEEVRQSCAREGAETPIVVFVDCLEAGGGEHALYELLLRRMVDELDVPGVPASIVGTLRAIHDEALRSTRNLTVRSLFATGMRELDRVGKISLVLVLDEFDDVFSRLAPWPFRQLRALRDALGEGLCYVTGTSRRLERLRSDVDTYEFRELFHLHTLVLQPLSEEDSRSFVAHLSGKRGPLPGDDYVAMVIQLCGGHPGLLDRAYSLLGVIEPDPGTTSQATAAEFAVRRPIRQECQRLWDELEQEEQEGLLALIGGGQPALDAVQQQALESKGLVRRNEEGNLSIFGSIFEAFVRRELARRQRPRASGVRCDFATG